MLHFSFLQALQQNISLFPGEKNVGASEQCAKVMYIWTEYIQFWNAKMWEGSLKQKKIKSKKKKWEKILEKNGGMKVKKEKGNIRFYWKLFQIFISAMVISSLYVALILLSMTFSFPVLILNC